MAVLLSVRPSVDRIIDSWPLVPQAGSYLLLAGSHYPDCCDSFLMTPSAPASTLYHHPSHLPLVVALGSFVISDGVLPAPVAQLLAPSPREFQELSFVE